MNGEWNESKDTGLMLTPSRAVAVWILLALGLFPIAVIAYNHLGEDCFITYRYAEQWAQGRGVVYNIGDRVEGYSNFLWMALLAGMRVLGANLPIVSRWMAVAAHAALVIGFGFLMMRPVLLPNSPQRRRIPWYCLWLPLAVWVNPLLHYHCDRGLEGVFYAALLGGALGAVAARRMLLGGIFAALAALTRPEGVFYSVALLPMVVGDFDPDDDHVVNSFTFQSRNQLWRHLVRFLTPVAVAWIGQTLFRYFYYDSWLPNTVIAKLGRGERPSAAPEILRWIIACNGLPIIAIAGAVYGWIRLPDRRRLIATSIGVLTAALVYQMGIGLVPSEAYRYLLPAIPPTLILTAILLEATHLDWSNHPWPRRILPLILLAAAFYLHPPSVNPDSLFKSHGDAPRSRFHSRLIEFLRHPDWKERWTWFHHEPILINANAGRWLRDVLAAKFPKAILAADQMGQLGYYASHDQTMIDLGGLMDREIARKTLIPSELVHRSPDFLILYSWRSNHQPLLPELIYLLADPAFQSQYTVWHRLQPRDTINAVEFVVWGKRTPQTPPTPQDIPLGPDTQEFNRWWRILESQ